MNTFESIKLRIASPEDILKNSHGEITKPETTNYRTQKPEKDGLFDERIFGPVKDWECYCGKYRRIRYKGVVCDKCGVEVTRAVVRRERMGHIKLAVPVAHIWFLRSVPSKIGLMLDVPANALERVTYYAAYIIISVDEQARAEALEEINREYKQKFSTRSGKTDLEALNKARDKAKDDLKNLHKYQVLGESEFHELSLKYGSIFEAGIGSETVRKLLGDINLEELVKQLSEEEKTAPLSSRKKVLKRLKLARGMLRAKIKPEWMFLTILPVLPPDLRPMVPLDGGRYATSDLNDLYRRVINRNNRLKKLLEFHAPEVIVRNEKRMLQEAVDALIDNSARRTQSQTAALVSQKRPLRSLADMLKGKQGRFRQNLLGKRVDYSGRSVIVVGPELSLDECGLPKQMALELFKPFVINKIIARELAHNIKGANRLIEEAADDVWAILEEVIQNKYVLLNRAPTLHRLGIQAFKPILVEGLAIKIHPMVCAAFNADFDGDQMAVHLPLSDEAQKEAREIMLSSKNLLKPATGESIAVPTQDSVLGVYYLSKMKGGLRGEGKIFGSGQEAILAYQFDEIDLQAKIRVRIRNKELGIVDTSVGRVIFNQALPEGFEFVNQELRSKDIKVLVGRIFMEYGVSETAKILDKIKKVGFEYATKSGISWGMDDLVVPKEKKQIIEESRKQIEVIENYYERGLLTAGEKKNRIIEVWKGATDKIESFVPASLDPNSPVFSIIDSRARGSWKQLTQIAGLKGLVQNPAGDIIDLPIISSFKEGFNVLEYFISTHGARKGSADTALRTASAGYLTRRLVDVAQDVVITDADCGDDVGLVMKRKDSEEFGISLGARIFGRTLLDNVKSGDGKIIIKAGDVVKRSVAELIDKEEISEIKILSPITCKAKGGICQKCYGYDLGHNQLVGIGMAVGIIAAQAIGEPGTQLTMRTFHTGGVATADDITAGLPRIQEVFEARIPKGKAVISEIDGKVVEIIDKGKQKLIRIAPSNPSSKEKEEKEKPSSAKASEGKKEEIEYSVSGGNTLWVNKNDLVIKGQQLSEGSLDLKELFIISGMSAAINHILNEVQKIYASNGSDINAKHIEVIIRQMFGRVRVKDVGDSNFTPGDIVEKTVFIEENNRIKKLKAKPATAVQLLMGITKVALTTESWMSAASFQETAKVLINAATESKSDKLRGLKENVILGRLIPAGTGYKKPI
ncbi:MAG: DNA-directed RNA polymerase subunit beta' [Candidatus Azambacteria bacterium]|nr:DNA-directed RNA polymerase subunit beta' [Candidatus Azambacteria bacterium]